MIIVISDSGTVAAPVGAGDYEYRDVRQVYPRPPMVPGGGRGGDATPCQIG